MPIQFALALLPFCTISVPLGDGPIPQNVIVVGDHQLLPNTPHQPIQIFVSGGGTNVQGVSLNAQIGDGGPLLGGTTVAPGFDGDPIETMITGTIFAANNTGVSDVNGGVFGNLVVWMSTTPASGFADASNGLLATLYVDTTGWFRGPVDQVWPLVLGPGDGAAFPFNSNGTTDLLTPEGNFINIIDGHIIIASVPEPSSLILGSLAFVAVAAWGWRQQRAR